jgi:hypothetical protein
MPSTETLRAKVEMFGKVKKPFTKTAQPMKIAIVVAKTSVSWLKFFKLKGADLALAGLLPLASLNAIDSVIFAALEVEALRTAAAGYSAEFALADFD